MYEPTVETSRKNLTIYPQRTRLLYWLLGFLAFNALLFLLVGWLVVLLFRLFSFTSAEGIGFNSFVGLFLFVPCAVVLFFLPALCWLPLNAMQTWLSPQPVLTITEQGVTVGAQPVIKSVFLSWADIATLSTAKHPFLRGTHLFLCPKERSPFPSCFSRFQYFFWRWLLVFQPVTAFSLPPWFLDIPAVELSSRVQQVFEAELQEHEIRIQTTVPYPRRRRQGGSL